MDNRIIDVLTAIRDMYGDGIFYNHTKTKNLMSDLSPSLYKERIQVSNFLEMNGYFQLKYAGRAYPIVRSRLIENFVGTYAVSEAVAAWVTDVFGALLGYADLKSGSVYTPSSRMVLNSPPPKSDETMLSVPPPAVHETPAIPAAPVAAVPSHTAVPSHAVPNVTQYRARPYEARNVIAADYHSVAVTQDGRVLATGPNDDGQCNVYGWENITAVAAGLFFTIGLRADGRVVATGRNDYGQCNVRQWTDIVEISAGARHTVGLRADGTVVATGQNKCGECNVHNWRNIIRIAAGYQCTFGVKKDHKVIVKGKNKDGDLTVSHLMDIADIANAAANRAIALRRDGTIARVGREDVMRKNFAQWTDIKQISAAPDYFAGLRGDGTVRLLAYFWADSGIECNVDDWRDMLAVAAGRFHILGLRKDGTVAAAMMHPDFALDKGQCNTMFWHNIKLW